MVEALIERPRLRGWLHVGAFLASIGALVWLVMAATSGEAVAVAAVYGAAAALVYLTSATYHVLARSPRARRVWQRLDHSMIFLLVAGTFTPVCVLGLSGPVRWPLLGLAWVLALTGIAFKVFAMDRFRKLGHSFYFILGVAAGLASIVGLSLSGQPWKVVAVVGAGMLYIGGAVLFYLGRPRLVPRWFGYHELWHALGISAGVLFFVVNLTLVRAR